MKKTLLFFCLMLVCLVLFGQTSIAPSAGDGSEGNPYQIANLENLYWIAADASRWSLYYIQTADIDASETSTWDDGDGGDPEGWTPIGNGTTKLTGSYDGQNHTINGLYINRGSIYGYISLFGYCYGASISNTNLTNVNITGHHYVAGLTGCNEYSAVINCSSSGSVNASGSNIGGLVGWSNTSSSISNSYSICNVNGYSTVGGLVGGNQNSAINRSYSCGSVSGGSEVGGLAGYIYSSSNIANNYSSSSVNGSVYIGGLTGNLYYSTISNCYSYGLISGTSEIGGLVGRNTSSTVNMSLWDMETSGQVSSAGGTGKTTAEMQTQSTFTDATWDFTDVWRMNASINDGYPYLQWQTALTEPTISTLYVTDTLIHNALVYYEISDVGNPDSVTHGICWNTSGNPTLADSSNIEGTVDSTGTYSSIMTGLSPNTLYYVRAYATNATGTAYGEVLSFTSLPEAELIAYWNFDEDNTNDVTGMHNGTITGSDVTFVNGKVRRAINFGGSGYGNVEIPSFNLPYITVEAWVNSAKYGYYTSMVTKNYYASSWTSPWVVWELWLNENTPYPATIGSQWHTVSIVPVSMNEWHHMAFTYDGYTVKVYVNGVEKSSAIVDAGPITSTNGNIYIGKPASANHNFIGMIDEVAIWDNALTPEDLLQHYQNGLNALGYVISEPIVSTDSVTEITMTSALCDANITSLGGDSLSAYGVCWGVDPLPTITDDKTDEGSKHVSGTFTSLMPDLSPNTAYYVRAYATNSVGTAYGEEICFTTLDILWKMQLSVNIGICNDNDNYLGVADDATNDFDVLYDEVEPPAGPGSSVSLSFPHSEWSNPLGDNFSMDIRPEIILSDTMQVWDFEVLSTDPGTTTITYTFTRVPDVPVILEDKAINLKRSLCSGDMYSFAAEANIPRLFSISIGDTTAPALALGSSCSGPAILCANTSHTLEWTMQDGNGIDSLQIWFSADSGENYIQIASPNTVEYYDWTLPDTTIIKNGLLKFTAQDYAGNITEKIGDHVFAIAGDSLVATVPAGWNLWGIPIEPENSKINMNLDDDFTAYYVLYKYLDNGYSFANSLCVAAGYWLGTTEETLIDISGMPLSNDDSLSLEQGWNLISDPLIVDILTDSLLFVKDVVSKTRNEAVSAGWINSIYGYSSDSYEYANKLQPWKGYWISVLETNVSMIFPLHQNRAPLLMKTNTTTPLIAFQTTAGDLHHNILAIGTEDNATFGFDPEYDAITPPLSPGPNFLSLYVPRTDLTNMILGNHFVKDIRATISGEQFEEWVIRLETSETSAQVTWTINAIPSELEIGIDIQGLGYFENMRDMETINVLDGQSFKVRIGANVVGLAKNLIPEVYALGDNYPNPFNPTTTIRYALSEAAYVRLTVYDLNGRAVRTLVSTEQSAGYKAAIWDGRNNTGDLVGSGIYLFRIEAGTFVETKKMAFMK